jgi:chemotaxis protein methyltransferase CheR
VEGNSRIQIWDAGCAMGPEPYTFLILLAEKMGYFSFKKVFMDASDLDENDQFGKIINNGLYHDDEIKRIPADIKEKYFKPTGEGNMYSIDDNVRNRINFVKHDLLSLKPFGNNYNLIICKNVLLHFQPEQRVEVFKMYHSVLAPNGMLVTEQTQQMPDACKHLFNQLAPDAQIYQKI